MGVREEEKTSLEILWGTAGPWVSVSVSVSVAV